MKIRDADIVIVPGDRPPGADHWQSRWEAKMATARLIKRARASTPQCDAWVADIRAAIAAATRPVVLVGHGLGVAACIHAVHGEDGADAAERVSGGFFVAPSDLDAPKRQNRHFKPFGPYPNDPLPFPSFVIASRTDPLSTYEAIAETAADWGAHLIDAGEAGHIDAESGHGPWPEGLMVFASFMKRLEG